MTPDVRRAALAAARLLFDQPKLSFYDLARLDVRNLTLPVNVIFDTFASYCASTGVSRESLAPHGGVEGMTVRIKGGYLVLYNEGAIERRRAWTLAHELGHIMLDHSKGAEDEEREADAFAASLLAPLPAMHYLEQLRGARLDVESVCGNFNLSRRASERRLEEMRAPRRNLSDVEGALMLKLFGSVGASADSKK